MSRTKNIAKYTKQQKFLAKQPGNQEALKKFEEKKAKASSYLSNKLVVVKKVTHGVACREPTDAIKSVDWDGIDICPYLTIV